MLDYHKIPSPAFVLETNLLRDNLELIRKVAQEADIEIILVDHSAFDAIQWGERTETILIDTRGLADGLR